MSPDLRDARFNGRLFILPELFALNEDKLAPNRINDLVFLMESKLPVGRQTARDRAVTGEPYVEFASGIRLRNMAEWRADEIMVRWMWDAFIDYYLRQAFSAGSGVRLYWRTKPELITFDANENFDLNDRTPRAPDMMRRIYMRYLISGLPAQEKHLGSVPA